MPTKTGVDEWSVQHLVDAALFWRRTKHKWTDAFDYLHRNSYTAGGDGFAGDGAQALQNRTAHHALTVANAAMDLEAAATVADRGAEDIHWGRDQVLNAVADAEDEGFIVGEDFSVTDRQLVPEPAREARMVEHAGIIGSRVSDLVATDKQVSGQLAAIQLTDFKEAPVPTPAPAPDKVDQFYRGISQQAAQDARANYPDYQASLGRMAPPKAPPDCTGLETAERGGAMVGAVGGELGAAVAGAAAVAAPPPIDLAGGLAITGAVTGAAGLPMAIDGIMEAPCVGDEAP